jgi:hypothetical protein
MILAGDGRVLITDHHGGFIDWDTYQANHGTGLIRRDQAAASGCSVG